jgi:hypothetical protein
MLNTMKTVASPLSRKATLVSVVISQWTARKYDKKITKEVNESHGAGEDAGRYNKLLIERERLAAIGSCVSQARDLHYRMTKPWCDEGMRILPNVLHEKFATEFRKIKREFDQAVVEFVRDYPKFVEERKRVLNGLYNESDYPSPNDIGSKFKLETKTFPVPDAGDFRSDVLDADTVEDIRRELTETSETVLSDAMKHSVEQIVEVVGHMSEKLKTYGQTIEGAKKHSFFTDSLVANVRELVEVLPAFNFTGDANFDRVVERMKTELCVEEGKDLRENANARAIVAKSADDILRDVSSLLG